DADGGAMEAESAPKDVTSGMDPARQGAEELGERLADIDARTDDLFADASAADLAGYSRGGPVTAGGGRGRGAFEDGRPLEETLATGRTLARHLEEQLPLALDDAADLLIAHQLIGMLDEAGYLREETAEIAARLGTDAAHVERIVRRLQTLDPPGVFARDLKECLRLQLADRDRLDPAMARLVDNLELVAKRDYAALRRICGVGEEDLREMLAELRELDPRPGAAVAPVAVQPVVPDVFVRPAPDGSWLVELNSETLPRVLVNNAYQALVRADTLPEADREYISSCLNRASWLVKSLDQRARTILAVAREIVRQQDAFLHRGVTALRPLTLRQVADALGMHESTVSRVTANKYMATPRGILDMKYFFTSAIATTDGAGAVSAETVRHRIRALIEAESAEAVLSDDRIVELLRAEGIDIARRTVAKYREAMGIPSSVQRRREKRLMRA
ncbi:MAG TPA: RNA polymerase sigma-54 factor, partial [Rhodospirillales bacterium]|nr:RNA polymerase sigma-54 factor [Rhodospirillales bacterium]